MGVITEARQLAAELRTALAAPAADEWNRLHVVTVKARWLARVPTMLASLERCRDDPHGSATDPEQHAQIQALIDDLKALKAQATA